MAPYRAPAWLPGGQLQTLWPALHARRVAGPRIAYRRERWDTPDGDFVDVDWLEPAAPAGAPLLVLERVSTAAYNGAGLDAVSLTLTAVQRSRGGEVRLWRAQA